MPVFWGRDIDGSKKDISANRKNVTIGSLCNLALVLFLCFGVFACKPHKVLDPHDPNFDIKQFRYEDYSSFPDQGDVVSEVLRTSFPIGTQRSVVEEVLVGGGAVVVSGHGFYKDMPAVGSTVRGLMKNLSPEYYAIYHMKYKKPFVSITPSGGVTLFAFYDEDDSLLYMILHQNFVHEGTFSETER